MKNKIREKDVGKLMEIVVLANMYYLVTSDSSGRTLLKIYEDPSLSKEVLTFEVVE